MPHEHLFSIIHSLHNCTVCTGQPGLQSESGEDKGEILRLIGFVRQIILVLVPRLDRSIIRDVQTSAGHDTAQVAALRIEPYPVTVSQSAQSKISKRCCVLELNILMTPTFSDLVTVEDTPLSHILLFVVVNIGSMSCSLMAVLITRSNGRYYSADTQ